MGLLQGRCIVDPIACHGHHLAIGLEGFHDPELLLGWDPGVDAAAGHHLPEPRIVQGLEFTAKHHLAVGVGEANAGANGPGRERVIAGDHHGANPGLPAGGYRLGHLGAGRIQLGHQAKQHLVFDLLVRVVVVGCTGKSEHPKASGSPLPGLLKPPVPLGFGEGHNPRTIDPTVAALEDHFRRPLAEQQTLGACCRLTQGSLQRSIEILNPNRHPLALGTEGNLTNPAIAVAQAEIVDAILAGNHQQGSFGGIAQDLPGPFTIFFQFGIATEHPGLQEQGAQAMGRSLRAPRRGHQR